MKPNYLLGLVLVLWSLSGCMKSADPAPAAANDLSGQWMGGYQTQQAGDCSWDGPTVTTTATFQVANDTVTATLVGPNGWTNQCSVPTHWHPERKHG